MSLAQGSARERPAPAAQPRPVAATLAAYLPLGVGALAYLCLLTDMPHLLFDGDTFWHIAAGRWIIEHRAIPFADPFSHSMPGAPWVPHEWLSEVLLASIEHVGGMSLVAVLTALSFAVAVALLTRALVRCVEPIYAFMFAAFAIALCDAHVLARPHVIAMPLMTLWTIELVEAVEAGRSPRAWMFPLMVVWANLHGGFTLGIALAALFGSEHIAAAHRAGRGVRKAAANWGFFLVLAILSALLTPNGANGFWFTWQVMQHGSYALEMIGEWRSPDFHLMQPLTIWLIGGMALVLYQGLRLPAVRLTILLALIYLALKHVRNIDLLGLLAPLVVATPFARQWRARRTGARSGPVAAPAGRSSGPAALLIAGAAIAALTMAQFAARPLQIPAVTAPVAALAAARRAGAAGPVLNGYNWGGYLAYVGIAPFVDGRADMYGDDFLRKYNDAVHLSRAGVLSDELNRYGITWTLLPSGAAANSALDLMPGWQRVYADDIAVVHAKTATPSAHTD